MSEKKRKGRKIIICGHPPKRNLNVVSDEDQAEYETAINNKCVGCGKEIKRGDGYYNYSSGLRCVSCGQLTNKSIDNQTFMDRLLEERNQLAEKVEKLDKFIESDKFKEVSKTQRPMLWHQSRAMRQYLQLLNMRIVDLNNNEKKTERL